jgi:hypothetical protein
MTLSKRPMSASPKEREALWHDLQHPDGKYVKRQREEQNRIFWTICTALAIFVVVSAGFVLQSYQVGVRAHIF